MRIPPKPNPLSKTQLRQTFADFASRNENIEHDGYDVTIEVYSPSQAEEVLLERIAPQGFNARDSRLFASIGMENAYEQLDDAEKDRLRGIAREVAQSDDFIMCSCGLVEALVDGPISECRDAAAIDLYSFLFHENSWVLTCMEGWDDSIIIDERHVFCLVRDVNSLELQEFNEEIIRQDGEGAFTLSTPLEEHDISPRDTLSWRNYFCTPWPVDEENDIYSLGDERWADDTPRIANGSQSYAALLHRMDEMNDYKNRLRSEVARLTEALSNLQG